MMVSQNLDVCHPYDGVSRFSDFTKEKKINIRHFRWLLALVVKKCFPNDYEESCLPCFKLIFSEMYLHQEVLKHNFMFQYFNLALYSNKHKFNFIHALKNFANRYKDLYYKENNGLLLCLGYNQSLLEMKKKLQRKVRYYDTLLLLLLLFWVIKSLID